MSNFYPNLFVKSIKDINLDSLKKIGIKNFIIDIDNTLVETKVKEPDEGVISWFKRVKASGINICLVSNNNKVRVEKFNEKLKVNSVHRAAKPMKRAFIKAMNILKSNEKNTAVIGDQIFTDVYGGNRMGLYTILVIPISPKESPLSKVKRPFEKMVLKKYKNNLQEGNDKK